MADNPNSENSTSDGEPEILNYFKPDLSTGHFKRVFSQLVSFSPHLVELKIGGETFALMSAYNLSLYRYKDWLLAYSHSRNKEPARFYPIPATNEFSEEDAQDRFPPMSNQEFHDLVYADQLLQDKLSEYNRLKDEFLQTFNVLVSNAAGMAQFAQTLKQLLTPAEMPATTGVPQVSSEVVPRNSTIPEPGNPRITSQPQGFPSKTMKRLQKRVKAHFARLSRGE